MKIALTVVLIYFATLSLRAQPIKLIQVGNGLEWPLSNRAYLFTTDRKLKPVEAFAFIKQERLTTITQAHINLGLQTGSVWLYFRLHNNANPKTVVFTIDRIDIHHVQCFRRRNKLIDTLALTGDALPFRSRPVQVNYFTIPIPMAAHEQADVLVLLEKQNEYISGNLGLYSMGQFLQRVRFDTALAAFFLGIAMFIFLFNFFLWFSLDDLVHLLFMAHQITIALYVLCSLGYGFEFLWPNSTYSNSLIMTMLSGVWASTNLFLMKKYLNLTAATSRFHRVVSWLAWYIFSVSIVGCSLALYQPASIPLYVLKFGITVLLIWIVANAVLLIAVFIEQLYKRNQAAYVYVLALSFMLTGSVVYILTLLNVVNAGAYTTDWLIPAFLWEEIILAFGLTIRYNRFRQQNFRLQLSLAEEQSRANDVIIQTQETERQRIAQDLHDDLGGTLATIRQRLADIRQRIPDTSTQRAFDDLEPLIEKSGQDLRRIAHNLMPPDFDRLGLVASAEQLVRAIPPRPTRFEFVTSGTVQPLSVAIELNIYRIVSELVQNIQKHAGANRASVQLLYEENQLTVLVEDDGVGISSEKLANGAGMGLKNAMLRANYIGATVQRETGEGGTFVVLEVPYPIPDHASRAPR
jgi:signal transduction histidine kinase